MLEKEKSKKLTRGPNLEKLSTRIIIFEKAIYGNPGNRDHTLPFSKTPR